MFYGGPGGWRRGIRRTLLDPAYDVCEPRVAEKLRELLEGEWSIGLHQSFDAWQDELDALPDTFVHEIEIGDLDADGALEVYATPSEPNRLDGTPQSGEVVRYVPSRKEGRHVVAALGDRHAKEILVDDVDGHHP